MSIIERFTSIMEANINALIDKAEDPAKMIDQTIRDLKEDLAEVKKDTASVMAAEKKAQRDVDICEQEIAEITRAAENAIKSGNDEDAKKLIAKKQENESRLNSYNQQLSIATSNANRMRQMHDKLVNDIQALEDKRNLIKAKVSTAKAQQKMNSMQSSIDTSSSFDTFERMEQKADRMLDQAMSEAELSIDSNSDEALVDKYSGGSSISVDEELAKMKESLGM